jgi:hypothetical protein
VWQSLPADTQGFVDLGALFGNVEHISAYFFVRVYSPQKQQLSLLCGSDDFIRVWLNGKRIHEQLREDSAVPYAESIPVTWNPAGTPYWPAW